MASTFIEPKEACIALPRREARPLVRWAVCWFTLTAALIAGARFLGPGDLYDKDQCKTIGYTADIVRNGRWLLPRDTVGREATKPPLYNWIGAMAVLATGSWTEPVFKFPSLLAGAVVVCLVITTGRRIATEMLIQRNTFEWNSREELPLVTGLVAAMFWLASYPVLGQIYLARPDMLMTAFITAAWVLATLGLRRERADWRLITGFWACVAGAMLTKGPAGLLPVLYVIAASRLIHGRFATLRRIGWWGPFVTVAIVAAWAVPAWCVYGEHLYRVMIRGEFVDRVLHGNPEDKMTVVWWQMPAWFCQVFAPWSALSIIAMVMTKGWFKGSLGPAMLWVIVGVTFFTCSAGKRADYLAPVYPQASLLAACWLMSVVRSLELSPARVAFVPALFAAGICLSHIKYSREAQRPYSDNMRDFAAACREIVGNDSVAFLVNGYHPFLPLIHRAGDALAWEQVNRATWVVLPDSPHWQAALISKDVADAKGRKPGAIMLCRLKHTRDERKLLRDCFRELQIANASN